MTFNLPDRSELEDILEEAQAAASLTDYEEQFLMDISERMDADPWWNPTPKQEALLRKIASRGNSDASF
jgi:hypothetical protein